MIAKEGLLFIFSGLSLSVIIMFIAVRFDSMFSFILGIIFTLLTLFTIFFFRDPDRSYEGTSETLVAPADGKIIGIDRVQNDFIGGEVIKVSIFLSVFNVHVNRNPISGTVNYVNYNPGEFHAAYVDKASELNEQTEIGITTLSGQKVIVKQIAGFIARRIICRLNENDTIVGGERFGIIKFGSRTELYIPVTSELDIKVGQSIKGGETIIGRLIKSTDQTEGENVIQ